MALWRGDGVMDALHVTPFGEAPGHVVINFATVDAIIHAWDLSASVGRPIEFSPDALTSLTAVVDGDLHRPRAPRGADQGSHRAAG